MTAGEILAVIGAAFATILAVAYLGWWIAAGHEPLLHRNCDCEPRR